MILIIIIMTFPLKSRFFSHSNWYIRSIMRQNIDFIICCSLFNSDICGNISVKIFQFYYFALFFPSIDFFFCRHIRLLIDFWWQFFFTSFFFWFCVHYIYMMTLCCYCSSIVFMIVECKWSFFFGSDMWKWMWKRKEKFIFFSF